MVLIMCDSNRPSSKPNIMGPLVVLGEQVASFCQMSLGLLPNTLCAIHSTQILTDNTPGKPATAQTFELLVSLRLPSLSFLILSTSLSLSLALIHS